MIRTGLEILLDEHLERLKGAKVGFCCNHTAVDRRLRHAVDLLLEAGVDVVRLFGPEHGVRSTAQDMEGVDEHADPVTGLPTVSLYGDDEASLHPQTRDLEGLDVLLFDIQDIGSRYYTYQATLGYLMQAAAPLGLPVMVLDRPNPINGVRIEGNLVQPGFESFVGAFPIAARHGLTMGELGRYFATHCGVDAPLKVIPCQGWARDRWFDQLDLPWVYPSPNMPTLDTATVYPGGCLLEATNISEGRGTTRPFHLIGAPWLDPQTFTRLCQQGAERAGLKGVGFRPSAFIPGFQKHAGEVCGGTEIHVLDRNALHAFLLGLVVVEAAYACDPERFGWRAEPYEFVSDPPAIDLLTGSPEFRTALEQGNADPRGLVEGWRGQLETFQQRREEVLLYR